jgi:hypothetical protein
MGTRKEALETIKRKPSRPEKKKALVSTVIRSLETRKEVLETRKKESSCV